MEERFEGVESKEKFEEDVNNQAKDDIIRALPIDNPKFMPDKTQRHWITA